MARADTLTITSKQATYFSDFLINLDRNPVTGLIARTTNEESIKASIRHLILTTLGERFYRPFMGSKIKTLLFDPMGKVSEDLLKTTISSTIRNFEPRANLIDVKVEADIQDTNAYRVGIFFECINIPGKTFFSSLLLKTLR